MNFAGDVVDQLPRSSIALVELARDGARREWSFGEVTERSARLAGTLERMGVRRGDVVMTLIGNRADWVFAMVACFRIGAVALPCTEQLRAKDLRLRLAVARPSLILADERNGSELQRALAEAEAIPVLLVPDEALREKIFGRIRREWHASIEALLDIMDQDRLLQGNPLLERSVRNRFPYLDPLNHVQVELMREHRAQNPDEQVLRGIQITINGISAGLRNTG